MSDISIPGITSDSRYKTDEIIQALMKKEELPLNRMEDDISQMEKNKSLWRDLSRKAGELRKNSTKMYNANNPFRERIVVADDESILKGTAARTAERGIYDFKVKTLAASDRLSSKSLDKDYTPPVGAYGFTVDDETVSFEFTGGSLNTLMDEINRRGKGVVRAMTVNNTVDSRLFIIEGEETGSARKIQFNDTARTFALEAGILADADNIIKTDVVMTSQMEGSGDVQEGNILLLPGDDSRILFDTPYIPYEGSYISYEVKVEEAEPIGKPEEVVPPQQETVPPEKEVLVMPPPPSAEFDGIVIEGASSFVDTPARRRQSSDTSSSPSPSAESLEIQRRDDNNILYIVGSDLEMPTPEIPVGGGYRKVRVPIDPETGNIESLLFLNNNTHRSVSIRNVSILNDRVSNGDFPINPISVAQNAILDFEGIETQRNANSFDDLIPGVTLELQKAKPEKTVSIEVTPNYDLISDDILNFVVSYNNLMTQINILTGTSEDIVDEKSEFTSEERETALENLGIFRGNNALIRMKNRLRLLVSEPYPTNEGSKTLSSVGIAANVSGTERNTIDRSRLRGYIELDTDILGREMIENIQTISDLFGHDSTGDYIVDSGAAFALQDFIDYYAGRGGIFESNTNGIDQSLRETRRRVSDYKEYLEDYEQDLKIKYGGMEGALNDMDAAVRRLEGITGSMNNNRR